MTIWRPWFRFRRVWSEQFEQGCLRRIRHHFALEVGMRDDARSELAALKKELVGLRIALAGQKAVGAMASAAAPAPAPCPRCRVAAAQPKIASRPASLLPVREPDRPLVRPRADDAREVIVLVADKSWP